MTDYSELVKTVNIPELVKALRLIGKEQDCNECEAGRWHHDFECCLFEDAAAAIEELDAEETRLLLITSELQDKVVELEEELNDADIAADDNARKVEELQAEKKKTVTQIFCEEQMAWEGRCKDLMKQISELQAEVKRLELDNEDYEHEHRRLKGEIEALQAEVKILKVSGREAYFEGMAAEAEPKRGEWELIDGAEPMRWGCSRCKYLSWETSNYCQRCGAKMNDSNASNALNALDNAQDGPIITPCRGCSDYDGYGGCKSKGGCARAKMEMQE